MAWLGLFAISTAMVGVLRREGRVWWCACGESNLWSGDPNGAHSSQHVFDPYTFTHILHGVLLCGILTWAWPRLTGVFAVCAAVLLEAIWEIVENSPFVIGRYRTATIALGYEGDSIVNSLGDLVSCTLGFLLARRIGLRWSAVVVVVIELALLLSIRDNLFLNILMLIFPLEVVKNWQAGP